MRPTAVKPHAGELERRIAVAPKLHTQRSASGAVTGIRGLAAVFGSITDIGGFTEEIAPHAFDDALRTSDVRGLFNHDPNLVLGRSPKTMKLEVTREGLAYEIRSLPKSRSDVAEAIERGDVTGSSFSFTVAEGDDTWTSRNGVPHRIINRVAELFDVGPVTFPAYAASVVSARSLEKAKKGGGSGFEMELLELEAYARARLAGLTYRWGTFKDVRGAATRYAYHEAGHAVYRAAMGGTITRIRVLDRDRRPSETWGLPAGVAGMVEGQKAPDAVGDALAGLAAEMEAGITTFIPADSDEVREALERLQRTRSTRGAARFAVEQSLDTVRAVLRRGNNWLAVQRLASCLRDRGQMMGDEVRAVISDALEGRIVA